MNMVIVSFCTLLIYVIHMLTQKKKKILVPTGLVPVASTRHIFAYDIFLLALICWAYYVVAFQVGYYGPFGLTGGS